MLLQLAANAAWAPPISLQVLSFMVVVIGVLRSDHVRRHWLQAKTKC